MKFAVNASIMFIFQKEAGKRRKRNKPIISITQICLLSFCFWVLRPHLVFHIFHFVFLIFLYFIFLNTILLFLFFIFFILFYFSLFFIIFILLLISFSLFFHFFSFFSTFKLFFIIFHYFSLLLSLFFPTVYCFVPSFSLCEQRQKPPSKKVNWGLN